MEDYEASEQELNHELDTEERDTKAMRNVKLSTLAESNTFQLAGLKYQVCSMTPLVRSMVPNTEVLVQQTNTRVVWAFPNNTLVGVE